MCNNASGGHYHQKTIGTRVHKTWIGFLTILIAKMIFETPSICWVKAIHVDCKIS